MFQLVHPPALDWDAIARRLTGAVKAQPGEKVLIRAHRSYFREVTSRVAKSLHATAIDDARPLPSLDGYDIFYWMPLGDSGRQLTPAERQAVAKWLDGGGRRRSIHFHWAEGSRRTDGTQAAHTPELDAMYARALDIDYAALSSNMDRAIRFFRQGTVRILTPQGTDLMFRTGLRPWNKQNGDMSGERALAARMRVDREIEYPAGVLRVAPIEMTPHGRLALPEMRVGDTVARKVSLLFDNGRISRVSAETGQDAIEAYLKQNGDSAFQFREFALGFNPKLELFDGGQTIPYFGYGAGVVRVSLGDNEELGGTIRGGFSRWFFLPDASVHVDNRYFVRNGKLVP
ncbi:MAG: hypothetical protein ACKV22_03885 [Bryobacteraceae bacterium]